MIGARPYIAEVRFKTCHLKMAPESWALNLFWVISWLVFLVSRNDFLDDFSGLKNLSDDQEASQKVFFKPAPLHKSTRFQIHRQEVLV